jgi:putative transposase
LRMLMAALKAESDAYVERHRGERDEQGRALVVRNGRGRGQAAQAHAGGGNRGVASATSR